MSPQPSAMRAADSQNPIARQAALRRIILEQLTDEKLQAIVTGLLEKATEGNVSAARLLLSYGLGKPSLGPTASSAEDTSLLEGFLKEASAILGAEPAPRGQTQESGAHAGMQTPHRPPSANGQNGAASSRSANGASMAVGPTERAGVASSR